MKKTELEPGKWYEDSDGGKVFLIGFSREGCPVVESGGLHYYLERDLVRLWPQEVEITLTKWDNGKVTAPGWFVGGCKVVKTWTQTVKVEEPADANSN